MPDTGETLVINNDEDIQSFIAMYLSVGLEEVAVNLKASTCLFQ